MRRSILFVLFVTLSLSAAAPKKAVIAPAEVPHSIAQFLRTMSKDGSRTVTFKASASGTRFFFEEASGVTVYRFVDGKYVKETFLAGTKLATAVKRYAKK